MSETITYTEADLELFDAGWKGSGRGDATVRAIKMVRPVCKTCQIGGDELVGWWDTCEEEGHDPYWHLQPKVLRIPIYVEDDDGDLVLDEAKTKAKSRTKFIRLPNITEVLLQTQNNSGEGPTKMYKRKGFKLPRDVGARPLCEASGCGKSLPKIRTSMGDFCSVRHAKLCIANETGVMFTVWTDPNQPQAKGIRTREMQEVQI